MLVEVLHLLKLIIGLFLMVTIVVVFILQTFKTLYDMGYLGNRSYPNLCTIHSEAIKLLYEGVPHEEVLKKLRKMRFDFKMPAPTNEKLRKALSLQIESYRTTGSCMSTSWCLVSIENNTTLCSKKTWLKVRQALTLRHVQVFFLTMIAQKTFREWKSCWRNGSPNHF